jgi:site-specific recombinase XerD
VQAARMDRVLADACQAAKINPAASFHTLRHTYASLMVMDSVPLMVVARNLEHATGRPHNDKSAGAPC